MKLENTEVSSWDSLALQLHEAKSKSKSQGRPTAAGTQPWPRRQRAQHQPALLGGMAGTTAHLLFLGASWQCQGLGRAELWPQALMVEYVLQERGRNALRIPAGMEAPVPEMASPTTVPAARASRAGSASWVSARLCWRAPSCSARLVAVLVTGPLRCRSPSTPCQHPGALTTPRLC